MIGIVMILMMLCIGTVAAERVGTSFPHATFVAPETPTTLAQTLVGPGITLGEVEFTGSDACANLFSGGSGIIGIANGVVLGSGDTHWAGPNTVDNYGVANGQPGDSDLDLLIPGYTTHDACVLEFDFIPTTNVLQFDYVFTSDEYNEYVNSVYNDVFGFFLNGQAVSNNIALIPGTTTAVAINNVNNGNPYGADTPSHPEFYRNNDLSDGGGSINTEMDGLTTVFTATALVNPGVTNHIKLAIADAGDEVLDSNVFLKGGSIVPVQFTLLPLTATNAVGTTHTVTASTGFPSEGIIVTFTITNGPNAGMTGTGTTDANGVATWSYSSSSEGTDTISASATFGIDPVLEESNLAYKTWGPHLIPEFPSIFLPATMIIGFLGAVLLIRRTREH
jgi:hypothetical protein